MVAKVEMNPGPTIEINGLKFTYPGIDGHPPPGSKPLIEDFSLTLNAGERCLLVGSNGAGSSKFSPFRIFYFLFGCLENPLNAMGRFFLFLFLTVWWFRK